MDELMNVRRDLVELSGYLSGMRFNCCIKYPGCHKCLAAYKCNKCSFEYAMNKLWGIITKIDETVEVTRNE